MMESRPKDDLQQLLNGLAYVGCCVAVLLPESVFFWFACLRENKVFWTNAGGYSLALRDAVLFLFYPLMVLNMLLLTCLTFVFVSSLHPPLSAIMIKLCSLLACWGLFSGALAVSGADNFINLLEGRPMRQRDRSQQPKPSIPVAQIDAARQMISRPKLACWSWFLSDEVSPLTHRWSLNTLGLFEPSVIPVFVCLSVADAPAMPFNSNFP
jgi:hypothetical protein